MSDHYTRAFAAAEYVRSMHKLEPRLAIILGSGLGKLCNPSGRRNDH
jgi:purine nucleoside phosphorylase